LCRIWLADRFQCIRFSEFKSGKTKPFMVILIGMSLTCLVLSDAMGKCAYLCIGVRVCVCLDKEQVTTPNPRMQSRIVCVCVCVCLKCIIV
jgi:hypothetical protein